MQSKIADYFAAVNKARAEMIMYHKAGNWRAANAARSALLDAREALNDYLDARDKRHAHKAFGLSLVVSQ